MLITDKRTAHRPPSLSKMPRRVCRPQAAKKVKLFSAATCAWQKIPLRLHVCELCAYNAQRVRDADCNSILPEKLLGVFRQSETAHRPSSCLFNFWGIALMGQGVHQLQHCMIHIPSVIRQ